MADDQPKTVYLGSRPRIEPGVEDVGEARALFLSLIPGHVPRALDRLAKTCLPAVRELRADKELLSYRYEELAAGGVTSAKLQSCVRAWAKEFHLTARTTRLSVPEWVIQQAESTLWFWAFGGSKSIPGRFWMIEGYEHEVPVVERAGEHPKHFSMRFRNQAEKRGFVKPPTVALEHYIWTVRFQVGEEKVREIVRDAQRTRKRKGHDNVTGGKRPRGSQEYAEASRPHTAKRQAGASSATQSLYTQPL